MSQPNDINAALASITESSSNVDSVSRLEDYTSQATIQYSKKKYDEAAELYAHATELQAEIYGEMSSRNADLLYAYGRCLYQVAVKKSDVLGPKVAGEEQEETAASKGTKAAVAAQTRDAGLKPRVSQASASTAPAPTESKGEVTTENKPYFQFTGDENFDTSEDEEADGSDESADAAADGDEAEDDDFANAYEILDLARVLLIQNIEERAAKNAQTPDGESSQLRQIQERLADTYDLQAEISLEGERFEDAVVDFRSALEWITKLFPFESTRLAEAHYKLSLALEFSSATQPRNSNGELEDGKPVIIDKEKRADAIKEAELAISSCKARISTEETKHRSVDTEKGGSGARDEVTKIEDVKDMVVEMEQRLIELRQDPNSSGAAIATEGTDPLAGVLSSIIGASAEEKKAILDNAVEGARDLTGLVKKRKPITKEDLDVQNAPRAPEQNGKRKREEEEAAVADKRSKS